MAQNLSEDLKRLSTGGRVCVVGVGNPMRGDDGIGPHLADLLGVRFPQDVVNAGSVLENYLGQITQRRPDTVVIVDAIDFGGKVGERRLFRAEDLGGGGISTHAPSLALGCEFMKARGAGAVFVLGVQPGQVELGHGLSSEVTSAALDLARELSDMLIRAATFRQGMVDGSWLMI